MNAATEFSKEQYEHVKGSRNVLFDYCKQISVDDFINQNTHFGRGGSMRNLLVHIANTYQYWIGNLALHKNIPYDSYESCRDINDVVELFDGVDTFMNEFIATMGLNHQIAYDIDGINYVAGSFKLFSHVITHEYHHKGQILSISRHLGYTPIDTDIMR